MSKYQGGGLVLSKTPQLNNQIDPNQLLGSMGVPLTNQWELYKDKELINLQRSQDNRAWVSEINKYQQQQLDNQLKLQTQERLNKMYDLQNRKFEFEILKSANDEITTLMEMDKDWVPPSMQEYYSNLKKQQGVDDESIANLSPYDLEEITRTQSKKRAIMYGQKNIQNVRYNLKTLDDNLKNAKNYLDQADELYKNGLLDTDARNKYQEAYNNVMRDRLLYSQTPVDPVTGMSSIDPFNSDSAKFLSTLPDLIDETAYKAAQELDKQEQEAKIVKMQADAIQSQADAMTTKVKGEQTKMLLDQANIAIDGFNTWKKQNPNATIDEISKKQIELVGPYLNIDGKDPEKMDPDTIAMQALLSGDTDRYEAVMKYLKDKNSFTYNSTKTSTANVTYNRDDQGNVSYTTKDGVTNYGGYSTNKDGTLQKLIINGKTYTTKDMIPKEISETGLRIITGVANSNPPRKAAFVQIPLDGGEKNDEMWKWVHNTFGGTGTGKNYQLLLNNGTRQAAIVGNFVYIATDPVEIQVPEATSTTSSGSSPIGVPAPALKSGGLDPIYTQ